MTLGQSETSEAEGGQAAMPAQPPDPLGEAVRQFVEHWGMMARAWGINPSMGELFALLYISGSLWTADALKEQLDVSRGNVSMNLRELMAWGVVHKVHRPGERREFYRAETDVWTLFRRILSERKRRELDPTRVVLERTVRLLESESAANAAQLDRIASLRRFFEQINTLATRLLTLAPDELDELLCFFDPGADDVDAAGNGSPPS
jgi:DNA-binding transcriptional regulator GbsR (MarR family)